MFAVTESDVVSRDFFASLLSTDWCYRGYSGVSDWTVVLHTT